MDPLPAPAGRRGHRIGIALPPLRRAHHHAGGWEKTYWHAGDGSLYENNGAETLLLMYLKQIQAKRTKRALLIAFDSSFPFAVGERRLELRSLPFSILNFDFPASRASWRSGPRLIRCFSSSLNWKEFSPTVRPSAPWPFAIPMPSGRRTLSDLPPACKAEPEPLKTPQEVVERIAEIPTRLAISSECDRQLLATAATKLVAEHRARFSISSAARRAGDQDAGEARPS